MHFLNLKKNEKKGKAVIVIVIDVGVWIIPAGPTLVSRVKQTSSVLFYLLYSFYSHFWWARTKTNFLISNKI